MHAKNKNARLTEYFKRDDYGLGNEFAERPSAYLMVNG